METRIVFNGQEYAGPEQMPDEVRKAFQEVLARLSADADHNGVADALQGGGNVPGMPQSSLTINGRTIENIRDLPGPLRWLVGSLLEHTAHEAAAAAAADRAAALPPEKERRLETLDAATNVLGGLLYALSAFLAGGLVFFGIWMFVHMDASSRSAGGEFYVAIGVLVAMAWLVGIVRNLIRRRNG